MSTNKINKVNEKKVKELINAENEFVVDLFNEIDSKMVYKNRRIGIGIVILAIVSMLIMIFSILAKAEWQCILWIIAPIVWVSALCLTIKYKRDNKNKKYIDNEKNIINSISTVLAKNKYKNYHYIETLLAQMEESLKDNEHKDEKGVNMIVNAIVPFAASQCSLLIQIINPYIGSLDLFRISLMVGALFASLPIILEGIKACVESKSLWKKKQVIRMMKMYNLYKIKYNL